MDIKMLVATLPEDANLSAWCRRLGVSRQSAYKWRARYRAHGVAGLQDRSRAARQPAGRTPAAVEDQVVALRKQLAEEGLDHGPASVRDRLAAEGGPVLSDATVWRILVRRGQINPHPAKRPRSSWRRFQRSRPNECWQGDDTHYRLATGQEVRIINLLDDHSRLNVDSLAVALCRTTHIWECFCRAVDRWGPPAEFLNDNGRAWISDAHKAPVLFQTALARLGVRQLHSSPYHPQTCGKVERFHQTQRRWLDAHPQAATIAELQALLDEFRHVYNHQRPHRGIGRRTPAAVWDATERAHPAGPAHQPQPTITRHLVQPDGSITSGVLYKIGLGKHWAGHHVTMIRRGEHATVIDDNTGEIVRDFDLDPTRRYQPTGRPRFGRPNIPPTNV